ncbi:hypothetical protein J2Y67_000063 [Neobacillus niacini]|nr:hypothetical protein [Neobacillus niacini]
MELWEDRKENIIPFKEECQKGSPLFFEETQSGKIPLL